MEPVETTSQPPTGEPTPASGAASEAAKAAKPRQKTMVGRVSSNKMDKTVVVQVEKIKRHRIYHRNMRIRVKYMAHDEQNACGVGDLVRIVETRPLSKHKRWRVVEILERGADLGAVV